MTREEEIRARLESSTAGNWIFHDDWNRDGVDVWLDVEHIIAERLTMSDAKFISYSKDDIDYLLKENQRLRGALEEYNKVADKFIWKCDNGLARSKETYAQSTKCG